MVPEVIVLYDVFGFSSKRNAYRHPAKHLRVSMPLRVIQATILAVHEQTGRNRYSTHTVILRCGNFCCFQIIVRVREYITHSGCTGQHRPCLMFGVGEMLALFGVVAIQYDVISLLRLLLLFLLKA